MHSITMFVLPALLVSIAIVLSHIGFRLFRRSMHFRDASLMMTIQEGGILETLKFLEEEHERQTGKRVPANIVAKRLLAEVRVTEEANDLLQRAITIGFLAHNILGIGFAALFVGIGLAIMNCMSLMH